MKHDILSGLLSFRFTPGVEHIQNVPIDLNYRLYSPKESAEKKPLILILHGAARRGNDNFRQLDFLAYYYTKKSIQKENPAYVLVPQCASNRVWMQLDSASTPFMHYNQDNAKEKEEITLMISLLNKLIKQDAIDTNRIYITGFSMGATGVWDIITRYPDMFAAAAIMAGSSDTSKAKVLQNTDVWAFTGENDGLYSPEMNEHMVTKINSHGGHAQHTIVPDVAHNCKRKALEILAEKNWPFYIEKSQ